LWLQLQELPTVPIGDAAGEGEVDGGWDEKLAAAYAQRVLDRIAVHAPGLRERVLALDVISPADLTAYNSNALHGDPYGGSAELDQNFWWRPTPSGVGMPPRCAGCGRSARPRTPAPVWGVCPVISWPAV
jgi:phytoene dehydrogenase-like protein